MNRWRRGFVTAVGLGVIGTGTAAGQDAPTNLQVLPSEMTRQEVTGVMRGFAMGLGVRCSYCHMGEEGQPLSEYDFASDEKATKRTARFMLRMAMDLNQETLPRLAEVSSRADPPVTVRCVTCHRGLPVPRLINEVIAQTVADEGAEAGVAKYRELREEYHGSGSYDFGEQPLIETAGDLARGEATDGALALYALTLEYFPESVQAWVGTAQVHIAREDTDAARAALQRALELQPENRQIQRMLQQLDGGG